jgi:phosphohistidine swiveling domain-containing protein
LQVNQRYAVIREEQARDFTLGWPALRACVRRLGEHMVATGAIERVDDVFFCNHEEVTSTLRAGRSEPIVHLVRERRHLWQRQRDLAAPLTLGQPVRLIGDVIGRAVQEARGEQEIGENVIVGHPASAGRSTGPVGIIRGPQDFGGFRDGDVLVAKTTAPVWTPLLARAAGVVTDSGSLAAHASLVAREYGIPAVVATGDATIRLHPGQLVTVDGSAGTITPHTEPITDQRESGRALSEREMSTLHLHFHRSLWPLKVKHQRSGGVGRLDQLVSNRDSPLISVRASVWCHP